MKKLKTINVGEIIEAPFNYNEHPPEQIKEIQKSIRQFGQYKNVVLWRDNQCIAGNGLVMAARSMGINTLDCHIMDTLTEEEARMLCIVDNAAHYLANSNVDKLQSLLDSLPDINDIPAINDDWLKSQGIYDDELDALEEKEAPDSSDDIARSKLTDKFLVPPFSILDTRQGYWQDRKKAWSVIIKDNAETREDKLGFKSLDSYKSHNFTPTSLLDPVLSELINLWFSPNKKNSNTFDCFAGDTVFGFVSSYLGNNFTGIELREEQATLNQARVSNENLTAKYICDDGQNVGNHIKENSQDLLFSCPPYFDLEVYSDLPNDASNQKEYSNFIKILDNAFASSIKCLKDNRFAVIVAGNIRDKKGFYYGFTDDIKRIFKDNGMFFYNDIILVNIIGTSAIRASACFPKMRKTIKIHQNVLVFYKGNPEKIKEYEKIEINTDIQENVSNNGKR